MSADRNVNYSAPVMPFEYEPDGESIWPCNECLPWHVEIVNNDVEGLLVREWHAVGCSSLKDSEV
ncbi:hypothetical protein QKG53_14495 [Clavibacter michiganensis]|uniref:hypothetical protein n=1 Tax=Clavibacter michiganensis TaxID=28447 RepID=UPI0026DB3070|nr:hypothetical protein [Clavibacter michiganensis]MDO4058029.1 hypothetical protein [Clavibacter michiganensis]MDO4061056.1 hypothetical protein [Clavibacter michiganensis]